MEPVLLSWSVLKQPIRSHLKLYRSAFNLNLSRKYSTPDLQTELISKEKIQLSKPSVTKWKRPPFVKNFFLGKFDVELMAFPEILDKQHLMELEDVVKSINSLYQTKTNSLQIRREQMLPTDVLQDLKDMGLFGRLVPLEYGGLDLTYTAYTRLNEVLGLDWSIYCTLAAHEFGTQFILDFGSSEQKRKYLPNLASGNCIAAVCCSELESGSDLNSMSTYARQNSDGSFTISGTKSWVTNAEMAGMYIVFAKTQNLIDPNSENVSVFIVEPNDDVQVSLQEKACLHGVQIGTVNLKEVNVPKENLIGNVDSGFHMYLKAMEKFRLALNTFSFGSLKVLLDSVTERVIHTERIDRALGDVQLVRRRLSRINSMIYAMETISYFTAALIDSTMNPDIALESAIVKIFNSEATLFCLRELVEAVGSSSLFREQLLERFYNDAVGLAMFDGPIDIAKLYVGLSGCKFVGQKKAEEILKMRNTFFFPVDHVKKIFKRMRVTYNTYKYDQDIAGHMHPSLVAWGNALEENLQVMEIAVEEVLSEHGKKVVDTQIPPMQLANAVVDLYAVSAVLSRCSRSYCIGLKNAHHEVKLTEVFCFDARARIMRNLRDISRGMARSNEGHHLLVGEQVIDCRGYFAESPLKHNY